MKKDRMWYLITAGILFCLFPAAYLYESHLGSTGIIHCFFRSVTGIECPFCGLTRAFAAAGTGKFQLAKSFHPAWSIAAAAVVFYGIILLSDALLKTSINEFINRKLPWLLYGVAGSVFAAGIVRYFLP